MSGVIEANHYRETRVALAADPIIVGMYDELPAPLRLALADGSLPESERWPLMRRALTHYTECGGTIETHIGGPLEAIELIARMRLGS